MDKEVEVQLLEQRYPAACGANHGEAAMSLQPVEIQRGAGAPVTCGGSHAATCGCLIEGCDPVGSWHWSKVLAGPVALWSKKPTLEQSMKSCSPWEGLMLEKLMERGLLWERPMMSKGRMQGILSLEEEGVAKKTWDELSTALNPHPVALLG
ncbi:hypothetical protein HGM15179_002113 [Zosterops borbonicus]|uniref:Uncharacterized protein n=1 Tax=Zosterops borbonicus TaxID=364589 RepID=A0A8K1LTE9_9PASS|nr:hypothetical protein HGM15179_002113 [Zosterops borbonicus]